MKKFLLLFILFSIFPVVPATAATFKNLDGKPYYLLVKQSDKTFRVQIEANGTIKELCSSCTVEVVGFSLLDIDEEAVAVIENGVLSIRE